MAEVRIELGGRSFAVGCRDGDEPRVAMLGRMIADRFPTAVRAAGGQTGERALLFAALMLADALDEAESRPPHGAAVGEAQLSRIADRLESLAAALEQGASGA